MSIKKSTASTQQKELENLQWNFKQYILTNKIINNLPKLVVDQIHTLSHNLSQCSFTNDKLTTLEGQVNAEDYVKELVFKNSKISSWQISKEKINQDDINYFKNNFSINFNEKEIIEYSFSRDIYSKKDINRIVLVVFPQYYYVKFQIMSDEIGVSELLNEDELKNVLQQEFT